MNTVKAARAIRHIAEELAGGGDVVTAVDALWALAEELAPETEEELMAYVTGGDDGDDAGDST